MGTNYVLTTQRKADIATRYQAGEQVVDLSREHGVSRHAIYALLRVRKVKLRPPPDTATESEWLTMAQAGAILGLPRRSVTARVKRGWLNPIPSDEIPAAFRARRADWYLRRVDVETMRAQDEAMREQRPLPTPVQPLVQKSAANARGRRNYDYSPEISDLIYLAGLFDGEGCVMYSRRITSRGTPTFTLVILVANTHEETLRWIERTFGGSIQRMEARKRAERGWTPCWQWQASSLIAAITLRRLIPWLRIKREQAQLAVEMYDRIHLYLDTHRSAGSGRPTPDAEEIAWRDNQVALITALKKKRRE